MSVNGNKKGFIILDNNHPDLYNKLMTGAYWPAVQGNVLRLVCAPEEEEVQKAIQELSTCCGDITLLGYCMPEENSTVLMNFAAKYSHVKAQPLLIA